LVWHIKLIIERSIIYKCLFSKCLEVQSVNIIIIEAILLVSENFPY